MWKNIWVLLQEPEAVLTVFHVLTHKAQILPENQEADTLGQVPALATDFSGDTADWVHRVTTIVPERDGILPRMPDCP